MEKYYYRLYVDWNKEKYQRERLWCANVEFETADEHLLLFETIVERREAIIILGYDYTI